jgi:hypothetical protein
MGGLLFKSCYAPFPHLSERDMPPPRSIKAKVNESKYPFVVELAIENDQLDVEVSRRIILVHGPPTTRFAGPGRSPSPQPRVRGHTYQWPSC